jgi:hypothetical protein
MFDYAITPTAVPRSVSPAEPRTVKLMITVTNKTGQDVDTRRLAFAIQAGNGPADLVDHAHLSRIRAAAGTGTQWDFHASGDGRFLAYPSSPFPGLLAGESIAFVLSEVIVNDALGRAVIKVTETTDGSAETEIYVTKQDPGLAITEFLAQPVQVSPDQESTLIWKATGGSDYRLITERSSDEVDAEGSKGVSPAETTVYTLSATGGGRTISQQVTVTVSTVRILDFSATPSELAKGDETTFRWQVAGARSCTLDPGGIALSPPDRGSKALPIDVSGPRTLIAQGYGRTDARTRPVTVMAAAITSFTAAPQVVPPGEEVTLSWTAEWATGFRLDPPGQSLDREVTRLAIAPRQSTTYRLTALGQSQPAREITVAAGAVIARFGLTAHAGQPAEIMLAWQVACGDARLEVWHGDGPPPGKPAPVPAQGDKLIALARAQLTSAQLTAEGGGVTAMARIHIAGPAAIGATVLELLNVASPSGITTERSAVTASWQATQGALDGWIRDEYNSRDLRGLAGQAELDLSYRIARRPLWSGDLRLIPPEAAPPEAAPAAGQAPAAARRDEPLAAWSARLLADGHIGLRWEIT